jgi:drug/metabolite transporter (DMT)-like permease
MSFGVGEFYSIACALLWAGAVILMRKAGESLTPTALNLFKNTLAAVLLGITVLVFSPALPALSAASLALILVSGLLGIAAGDNLYLAALNRIGASRMAAAQTLYSPFVLLLSALFLGERLTGQQWLGAAAVLGGVVVVNGVDGFRRVADGGVPGLGRGLALGAASVFLMAVGVLMSKPMLEAHDFLWVVWLRVLAGVGGLLVVVAWQRSVGGLLAEYRAARHWPQIVAAAVAGTYLSMLLWLAGYKYTAASVSAVLNETAALFIVLFAVIFLHERIGRRQVAGIALAMLGVVLMVLR